jgi:hypothetical protein
MCDMLGRNASFLRYGVIWNDMGQQWCVERRAGMVVGGRAEGVQGKTEGAKPRDGVGAFLGRGESRLVMGSGKRAIFWDLRQCKWQKGKGEAVRLWGECGMGGDLAVLWERGMGGDCIWPWDQWAGLLVPSSGSIARYGSEWVEGSRKGRFCLFLTFDICQ